MGQLIKFFHFILAILTADPKGAAETTNSDSKKFVSEPLSSEEHLTKARVVLDNWYDKWALQTRQVKPSKILA